MTQYTFVTESHLGGDEKSTVDILSRRDVERIADAAAGNALQPLEERLSRRIERIGKAASEAKEGADEARMGAKAALDEARSTAERIAGSARDTFRSIVAESLMPILESALGQVLDKQKEIQRDHKSLQNTTAEFRLELAAAGERGDVLDRKISDLRTALEALRTDAAAAQEAAGRRWAESESVNGRFRDELDALHMDAEESRRDTEKRFAAMDAEKLRIQGDLEAISNRLRGELDSLRGELAAARQAGDGKLSDLEGENRRLREDIETLRAEEDAARRETAERLSGLEAEIQTLSAATGQAGWAKECQVLRAGMARLRRRFAWAGVLLLAGMLGLCGVLWGREGGKPAVVETEGMSGAETAGQNRADAGEYAENEGGEIPPGQSKSPVATVGEAIIAAWLGRARAGEKEAQIQVGRLLLSGRSMDATDKEAVRWVLSAGRDGAEGVGRWLAAQARDGNRVAQGLLQEARQGDARAQALLEAVGVPVDEEVRDTESEVKNLP